MKGKISLRQKLRKLDFQALEVFYNLYQHQSVTEVSEVMSLSPSTISYCLNRLRLAFEDELFISRKGSMKPTLKSVRVSANIENILREISDCAEDKKQFSPKEKETTFIIFSPEYFEILVIPLLIKKILHEGLKIKIEIIRPELTVPFESIANRQIDLGLVLRCPEGKYPMNLCSQSILRDELVAVFDGPTGSPQPLTIKEMTQYKQIYPSPWLPSNCLVDNWLKERKEKRTVTIKANGYYSGLKILASSEMMMMLPRKIYRKVSHDHASLYAREAPEGMPNFELDMIWSQSSSNNQANKWLRRQIYLACQELNDH